MIKSRTMRWAGYIARMGAIVNPYRFWSVNLKEIGNLENLGIDGRFILCKRDLQDMVGRTRTGLIWLRIGTSGAGCCDHGNETIYLLTYFME